MPASHTSIEDNEDLDGKLLAAPAAPQPPLPKPSLARSKSDGDGVVRGYRKEGGSSKKIKSSGYDNPQMDTSDQSQPRVSAVSFSKQKYATKERRRRHSTAALEAKVETGSRRSRTPERKGKVFPLNEPRNFNKRRSKSDAEKNQTDTGNRRGRSNSTSRRRGLQDSSKSTREVEDNIDKSIAKLTRRSRSVPSLASSNHGREVEEEEEQRRKRVSGKKANNKQQDIRKEEFVQPDSPLEATVSSQKSRSTALNFFGDTNQAYDLILDKEAEDVRRVVKEAGFLEASEYIAPTRSSSLGRKKSSRLREKPETSDKDKEASIYFPKNVPRKKPSRRWSLTDNIKWESDNEVDNDGDSISVNKRQTIMDGIASPTTSRPTMDTEKRVKVKRSSRKSANRNIARSESVTKRRRNRSRSGSKPRSSSKQTVPSLLLSPRSEDEGDNHNMGDSHQELLENISISDIIGSPSKSQYILDNIAKDKSLALTDRFEHVPIKMPFTDNSDGSQNHNDMEGSSPTSPRTNRNTRRKSRRDHQRRNKGRSSILSSSNLDLDASGCREGEIPSSRTTFPVPTKDSQRQSRRGRTDNTPSADNMTLKDAVRGRRPRGEFVRSTRPPATTSQERDGEALGRENEKGKSSPRHASGSLTRKRREASRSNSRSLSRSARKSADDKSAFRLRSIVTPKSDTDSGMDTEGGSDAAVVNEDLEKTAQRTSSSALTIGKQNSGGRNENGSGGPSDMDEDFAKAAERSNSSTLTIARLYGVGRDESDAENAEKVAENLVPKRKSKTKTRKSIRSASLSPMRVSSRDLVDGLDDNRSRDDLDAVHHGESKEKMTSKSDVIERVRHEEMDVPLNRIRTRETISLKRDTQNRLAKERKSNKAVAKSDHNKSDLDVSSEKNGIKVNRLSKTTALNPQQRRRRRTSVSQEILHKSISSLHDPLSSSDHTNDEQGMSMSYLTSDGKEQVWRRRRRQSAVENVSGPPSEGT